MIKKIMRFQHFLETTLITKIWIERYEDVVSLTYISNYGREDVGASACCLSLNWNTVEGYR